MVSLIFSTEWFIFLIYFTVLFSIDDMTWTPRGLSVQPKVDKFDFPENLLTIEYRCGGELLEAAHGDAENQTLTSPLIQPTTSHNYSLRPHVLKIRRQGTLRATTTDNNGEPIPCGKEIPPYPGKKNKI